MTSIGVIEVIEPITHSEWAAPIAPVIKSSGDVRICGDFKVTVNQCLGMERQSFVNLFYVSLVNIFDSMSGKDVRLRTFPPERRNKQHHWSVLHYNSEVYACMFKGKKVLMTAMCLHWRLPLTTLLRMLGGGCLYN